MIQIYHNVRCGKSRNCLAFLEKSNLEFEIIYYLVDNPTFEELTSIIKKLNINAIDLVRKNEKIWINLFKNKTLTEKEIIQTMVDNPILIERPILVTENKAIIARDLDKIQDFIEKL